MARKRQPWERIPGGKGQRAESEKAYEAFWCYLSLGHGRTFIAVAEKLRKSSSLIRKWKDIYSWESRAAAWDASIIQEAHDKAVAEYAEMIERHIQIGRFMQSKAENELQGRNLGDASVPCLSSMLCNGVEIERAARDAVRGSDENEDQRSLVGLFAEVMQKAWGEG